VHGRGYGSGFGPPVTPPIIKQLLIITVVVFVGQVMAGAAQMNHLFGVTPAAVVHGGYLWQPFTYMWLHGGLLHLAMNCFVLWMFGSQLALAWGAQRFLRYYLLCGVGAGLIITAWPFLAVYFGSADPTNLLIPTVGASGAIYGVLLAYSLTWPDRTIMLIFPPVAFRAIWLIPIIFFMTLYGDSRGAISHVGHLGGVIVGWIYLQRRGDAGSVVSVRSLKHRWRRYRMRQKLRAIRYEDFEARRRREQERRDRTIH
jgi:membrane associated rhomboid family serine protease